MSARKIFAALILVFYAQCSSAEVTPKQVLSDPRFYPLVEATRKHGAEYLPGRYVVTMELPSRTGGPLILASTQMIIEIGEPDPQTYPFRYDIHGGKKAEGYMILDTESEAPMLISYTKNESGKFELSGKSYAGLYENDKSWLTGAVSDGSLNILIPINNTYFPEGWYLGAWKCSDGTQFIFDGGKMYAGGHEIGTFTVDDNRITVTAPDGSKDTVYALLNPYKDILVMTFSSGPNGMGVNAGVFERMNDSQKPKTTPTIPEIIRNPETKTPKTQSPTNQPKHEPKMPTEFPPMPKVNMPPQNIDITGVWGAYVEGKQVILQYQGNNYFGWINGVPSEMGIFTINGNTITGTSSKGEKFTNEIDIDDSGEFLDMTYTNGLTVRYQKLQ